MVRLYEAEIEKDCKYGYNVEDDLKILLETCKLKIKNPDLELIEKAFRFTVNEFKDIERLSKAPYYTHCLKVALILMNEIGYADNETVAAALLHDSIQDIEELTQERLSSLFGEKISTIVEAVTKIKGERTRSLDTAATYAKLFEALIGDIRVILIKLADRMDNLRTLQFHKPESIARIAGETLNFYTPVAHRLGLNYVKMTLEDLSLYYLDREKYEEIKQALDYKRKEFITDINKYLDNIETTLKSRGIEVSLAVDHKHIYEIYKMIKDGKTLGDIDNFYSIVIVLPSNDLTECYTAYGIIASLFGVARSFVDYISSPKINLYKAIHSTHFGVDRKYVEFIIRTEEMDDLVQNGMTSLYSISQGNKNLDISHEDMLTWTQWMQDIVNDGDPDAQQKIWGTIKMNLYSEYINVYDIHRNLYRLPKGSCPIDFAFQLGDEFGYKLISFKVNGKLENLKYELNNEDVIEILTSPNSKPTQDWLGFVVTPAAVGKLYSYFKNNLIELVESGNQSDYYEVKFRVTGDDKPGMLNYITNAIGTINILRINLYQTSVSAFEGMFTLYINDESVLNGLFTRLLGIKGLKGVERVYDDEL